MSDESSGSRRLKGLDECRAGEIFERRREGGRSVLGRDRWARSKPQVVSSRKQEVEWNRPPKEPLTGTTVLFVLAAAVCAGLAAGLIA